MHLSELLFTASNADGFDPLTIGDPIATRINWGPAQGSLRNSLERKAVEFDVNRLEFRIPIEIKVLAFAFIFIGVAVISNLLIHELSSDASPLRLDPTSIAISVVSLGTGFCMLFFRSVPIVFDKHAGAFWNGRKAPHEVIEKKTLKNFSKLENIHALQLISKEISLGFEDTHLNRYELNLVLKNGNRINVVNSGNRIILREDTDTLAAFLDKPVWDATESSESSHEPNAGNDLKLHQSPQVGPQHESANIESGQVIEAYNFDNLVKLWARERLEHEVIVARELAKGIIDEGLRFESINPKWIRASESLRREPYVGLVALAGSKPVILRSEALDHLRSITAEVKDPDLRLLSHEVVKKDDFRIWLVRTGRPYPKFWFSEDERAE